MEPEFIAILQKLVAEQGKETLLNAAKCKAFLSDYTRGEHKKECRVLLLALEAGVQKAIDTAENIAICKTQQIGVLHEDFYLVENMATDVVDTLVLVLRGDMNRTEMQKESLQPVSTSLASSQHPAPNVFVRINGGTFLMGSPGNEAVREDDEGPRHQITVSSFYMGKFQVTQAEYQSVTGTNPSKFLGYNLPVETVSWFDAVEYCNTLSQREGLTPVYTVNREKVKWNQNAKGYRLPTEAEWEYACRAGTTMPFSTGINITTNQANYDGKHPYNNNAKGEYRKETTAVGSFVPNPWGLYDMHGNVWEWCWDWHSAYSSGVQINPIGAVSGVCRVIRGGSWISNGKGLRSAFRNYGDPSLRNGYIGFRLVHS